MDLKNALIKVVESLAPGDRYMQENMLKDLEPAMYDRLFAVCNSKLSEKKRKEVLNLKDPKPEEVFDIYQENISNLNDILHKALEEFLNEYIVAMGWEKKINKII